MLCEYHCERSLVVDDKKFVGVERSHFNETH